MELLKAFSEAKSEQFEENIVKANVIYIFYLIIILQDKQLIPLITADLKKIIKDQKLVRAALKAYFILLNIKEKSFKDSKERLEFLESFKSDLVQMINQQIYLDDLKEAFSLLRYFFQFYAGIFKGI